MDYILSVLHLHLQASILLNPTVKLDAVRVAWAAINSVTQIVSKNKYIILLLRLPLLRE